MTADVFRSGSDLDAGLRRAAAEGGAHVPGILLEGFLRALHDEIRSVPFVAAPEVVGEVRQETESCTVAPGSLSSVERLRGRLVAAARSSGIRGLATWEPNEVTVQRYRPGSTGITSHRDGKRFRRLVAVVTTRGRARFAIRRERHGDVVDSWVAGPGSLVLLRGPGLAGTRDGRPFHEVSGPREGVRYSVGFRMEVRR